jgi:hypothetical protein
MTEPEQTLTPATLRLPAVTHAVLTRARRLCADVANARNRGGAGAVKDLP